MPAFDTHKAVKELCHAGFDNAKAEAVVDQISGAVNENVATKTDIQGLATSDELRDAIAPLATRDELRQELARHATEEKLREEIAKLATREDLKREIGKLDIKLDNAVEKLELRLEGELEKQATRYLRSIVVVAAAFVGLSKALDLLVG